MSEAIGRSPAAGTDDDHVEAVVNALGTPPQALERLQDLRVQAHDVLNEEFGRVATDLEQLRRLLSDAAEKLSGTFRVVTARSSELSGVIERMEAAPDAETTARIRRITADVASTTGQTIQSLQFEDMATQLLQHVHRKLDVLARFSKDMAVLNPGVGHLPPLLRPAEMDALFASLAAYRTELSVTTRKVVKQESVAAGDIELF